MPIIVICPTCGAKVKAPDQLAGKVAKCPKCQSKVQVPTESNAPIPEKIPDVRLTPSLPSPEAEVPVLPDWADESEEVKDRGRREKSSRDDSEDDYDDDSDDRPVQRKNRRHFHDHEAEKRERLFGGISLGLGGLSLILSSVGCCCIITWIGSVPIAIIGIVMGILSRGALRISGIILNVLSLVFILVMVILIFVVQVVDPNGLGNRIDQQKSKQNFPIRK